MRDRPWNDRPLPVRSSLDADHTVGDSRCRVGESEVVIWIVPARADGRWTLKDERGFWEGDLDGGVRTVRASIDGAAVSGSLRLSGNLTPITGRRR